MSNLRKPIEHPGMVVFRNGHIEPIVIAYSYNDGEVEFHTKSGTYLFHSVIKGNSVQHRISYFYKRNNDFEYEPIDEILHSTHQT